MIGKEKEKNKHFRTMNKKKIYSKPLTEVTSLNLVNSMMETLPVQDPSYRSETGFAQENFISDFEDDEFNISSKSLWD